MEQFIEVYGIGFLLMLVGGSALSLFALLMNYI